MKKEQTLSLKKLSSEYNTADRNYCYKDSNNKNIYIIQANGEPKLVGYWKSENKTIDFIQEEILDIGNLKI